MRSVLEYISTGKIDASDVLVADIADAVDAANADRRWVDDVFSVSTIQENLEREVRMAHRAIAKAQKEAEAIQKEADKHKKEAEAFQKEAETLQKEVEVRRREVEALEKEAATAEDRGEARFGLLVDRLIDVGRPDDLKRAAEDAVFRDSLYREFGIPKHS